MTSIEQKHTANLLRLQGSFNHGVAASRTSDRYEVVNTMEVVSNMIDRGFMIDQVTGSTSSKINNPFGKHRVTLIAPDTKVGDDGTCARVILQNSYDGLSRFTLLAGLFRFACSNGMVFGQIGEVAKVNQKHIGNISQAIGEVDTYIDRLPQLGKIVSLYKQIEVAPQDQEMLAFALAADRQQIIWGSKFDRSKFSVDVESMLDRVRVQDAANDAWTVFNTLQEKVVRGGYIYNPTGNKQRKAKALKNQYTVDAVNQSIAKTFNKQLVAA